MSAAVERFGDGPVPPPPHWGGFRVRPETVEFWQGRSSRLHDRLRYRHTEERGWTVERLAP
jgi:pyridoxamine 5'-phosphate oxidase